MVFSRVGPNQSIESGQMRVSKSISTPMLSVVRSTALVEISSPANSFILLAAARERGALTTHQGQHAAPPG